MAVNAGSLPRIVAAVLLAVLVSTCSWTVGRHKVKANIPDPNRCGPTGIACGYPSEGLCCDGKTQVCCTDVVKAYCGSTCL